MDGASRAEVQAHMVRYAQGHRDAFAPVYAALWPELRTFTGRLLADPADAEDAAQGALLKVFSRISDFDTRRDGISWAFAIAAYEVQSLRKRRTRRCERDAAPLTHLPGMEAWADEALIDAELRHALAHALTHLSDADRDALLPAEAAGTGGPVPAHLRKRRQRALERLRTFWRNLHGPV